MKDETQEEPGKLAVGIIIILVFCAVNYGVFSGALPAQKQLAQQIQSASAEVNKTDAVDYDRVVFDRWLCRRVVFTTASDGSLGHILIEPELPHGVPIVLYPHKVEVSSAGDVFLGFLDWKVWEDRFKEVQREAADQPVKPDDD